MNEREQKVERVRESERRRDCGAREKEKRRERKSKIWREAADPQLLLTEELSCRLGDG